MKGDANLKGNLQSKGVRVNLPQFNGHSKKRTIVRGVNNDKTTNLYQRVQAGGGTPPEI